MLPLFRPLTPPLLTPPLPLLLRLLPPTPLPLLHRPLPLPPLRPPPLPKPRSTKRLDPTCATEGPSLGAALFRFGPLNDRR